MAVISFFNVLRQGIAGILNFTACMLSLPSAVMADIASLIWNDDKR